MNDPTLRLGHARDVPLLAEADGTLLGYVVAVAREKAEGPFCPARKWWEVDQIGVTASRRRTGVGRALLQKVIAEAEHQKIRAVELSTWAFNAVARRSFESLGFAPKVLRYELLLDERPDEAPA